MNKYLTAINNSIYQPLGLILSDYQPEAESKTYDACQFVLNGLKIASRTAKITPKKAGQFVTFWKRSKAGPIAPFHEKDAIDFFIVNTNSAGEKGQFVFPLSVLIKKGILSTDKKEGKRAFRVYLPWDKTTNTQSKRSQAWQSAYFYEINNQTDLETVKALYQCPCL